MFLLPSCNLATIRLRQTPFIQWLFPEKSRERGGSLLPHWEKLLVSAQAMYIVGFFLNCRGRLAVGHYDGPQRGLEWGKIVFLVQGFLSRRHVLNFNHPACYISTWDSRKMAISNLTLVLQGCKNSDTLSWSEKRFRSWFSKSVSLVHAIYQHSWPWKSICI